MPRAVADADSLHRLDAKRRIRFRRVNCHLTNLLKKLIYERFEIQANETAPGQSLTSVTALERFRLLESQNVRKSIFLANWSSGNSLDEI